MSGKLSHHLTSFCPSLTCLGHFHSSSLSIPSHSTHGSVYTIDAFITFMAPIPHRVTSSRRYDRVVLGAYLPSWTYLVETYYACRMKRMMWYITVGDYDMLTVVKAFEFPNHLWLEIRRCMASGCALTGKPPNNTKVCYPRLLPRSSLTSIPLRSRKLRAIDTSTAIAYHRKVLMGLRVHHILVALYSPSFTYSLQHWL